MANDGWKKIRLGDLIQIKHGFAFKGEYFCDEPTHDALLTPGNFAVGGGFKDDKLKFYCGPVPEEYVLRAGDLIVTMTDLSKAADTLGYPAIVPDPAIGRRYLHNQRLGLVTITKPDELQTRFLYYLMCTRRYRHHILAGATGTTVKHTSPTKIREHIAEIPPLPVQHRIADILGKLDDKIELNRRMNRTLEKMAAAIFKSWFIDFDPVHAKAEGRDPSLPAEIADLFPDSFEESELGAIPKGWKASTVGNEFNLTMGQSPPGSTYNETGDGIPFFQGKKDFGFRYPSNRVYCTAPTRFAEKNDSLVSVRAPVGAANMALEKCCVGRGVAAVRHKSESRSYTYYAMRALGERFEAYEANGTVFGSISKKEFQALKWIAPPLRLVEEFERTVFPLDQRIEVNENQNRRLAGLRDTLLPKLLSGEIEVPEVEAAVEEVAT